MIHGLEFRPAPRFRALRSGISCLSFADFSLPLVSKRTASNGRLFASVDNFFPASWGDVER